MEESILMYTLNQIYAITCSTFMRSYKLHLSINLDKIMYYESMYMFAWLQVVRYSIKHWACCTKSPTWQEQYWNWNTGGSHQTWEWSQLCLRTVAKIVDSCSNSKWVDVTYPLCLAVLVDKCIHACACVFIMLCMLIILLFLMHNKHSIVASYSLNTYFFLILCSMFHQCIA